ncbi:Glycine-rich RNA-binding protein 2, mitochondrial [Morella rubra]|uniref:Glycine-rich RNA-binding protein 2, mitochondrial n=1 Tax=Morella rubra TaxID=262757 RepID=A0A6A1VNS8_9ROSI|nr:Glycine-rich RNA-binding protein 2, mitochondrial [Morella rubra]
MAFCNKLGGLLRWSASQNGQTSMSSMLNSVRCMSSSKLFVGGLSYTTDDQSLKDAFVGFGDVVDAKVIVDRDTGRSRGFGFVNYSSNESASEALSAMDGQELNGRNIRVSFANERPAGPRSFGGGGGGGYRGDGGFGGGDNRY